MTSQSSGPRRRHFRDLPKDNRSLDDDYFNNSLESQYRQMNYNWAGTNRTTMFNSGSNFDNLQYNLNNKSHTNLNPHRITQQPKIHLSNEEFIKIVEKYKNIQDNLQNSRKNLKQIQQKQSNLIAHKTTTECLYSAVISTNASKNIENMLNRGGDDLKKRNEKLEKEIKEVEYNITRFEKDLKILEKIANKKNLSTNFLKLKVNELSKTRFSHFENSEMSILDKLAEANFSDHRNDSDTLGNGYESDASSNYGNRYKKNSQSGTSLNDSFVNNNIQRVVSIRKDRNIPSQIDDETFNNPDIDTSLQSLNLNPNLTTFENFKPEYDNLIKIIESQNKAITLLSIKVTQLERESLADDQGLQSGLKYNERLISQCLNDIKSLQRQSKQDREWQEQVNKNNQANVVKYLDFNDQLGNLGTNLSSRINTLDQNFRYLYDKEGHIPFHVRNRFSKAKSTDLFRLWKERDIKSDEWKSKRSVMFTILSYTLIPFLAVLFMLMTPLTWLIDFTTNLVFMHKDPRLAKPSTVDNNQNEKLPVLIMPESIEGDLNKRGDLKETIEKQKTASFTNLTTFGNFANIFTRKRDDSKNVEITAKMSENLLETDKNDNISKNESRDDVIGKKVNKWSIWSPDQTQAHIYSTIRGQLARIILLIIVLAGIYIYLVLNATTNTVLFFSRGTFSKLVKKLITFLETILTMSGSDEEDL